MSLERDLTNEELNQLDDFLAAPSLEESSMDLSMLEGFLAAVAIGPRTVMPSGWIPWVWDMRAGNVSPEFKNMDEANRIMNLLMRNYNAVLRRLSNNPAGFEPIYQSGSQWGAAEWCEGFLLGMRFDREAWSLLMVGQPTWFTPFMRLGTHEGIELVKSRRDGNHWTKEVAPSLVAIHGFWKNRREAQPAGITQTSFPMGTGPRQPMVRETPKIGRNDPCPCGSGRKYKKCCGADTPSRH